MIKDKGYLNLEKKYPKISIVTPSYNQAEFIEQTILSIINQSYPHLEYIIIDGGSTDESVQIIKKYEKHLKYWISEPDNGQVDAINKGLRYCTGDIFNWINSDDYLAENSLNYIAENYQPGYCIAGKVYNFSNDQDNEIIKNKNLTISNILNGKATYHQPGFWYCLKDLRNSNQLNPHYHYSFDIIHLLEYLLHNPKIKYIDDELVFFRLHELSKTGSGQLNFEKELLNFLEGTSNNTEFFPFRQDINPYVRILKSQIKGRQFSIASNSYKEFLKKLFVDLLEDPLLFKNRFYLSFMFKSLKKLISNDK